MASRKKVLYEQDISQSCFRTKPPRTYAKSSSPECPCKKYPLRNVSDLLFPIQSVRVKSSLVLKMSFGRHILLKLVLL